MFFWNSLAFLMVQQMLAIWSLAPLPFLKSAWTSGRSRFTYCWSLAWRILSITSLALLYVRWVQLCGSLHILWHCLSLGLEWKLTFSSPVATAEFSKLLTYWVQHFHSIIFRIWNSPTGILSPPLALFTVMLSKAHLTSHSRVSGSRWVITPPRLSESWSSFLYISLYSCHLFLISSAYVRSLPFLSFIEPIFAWNVPLVSLIFLKRSLVFSILLFSSISLHWSLKKALLSLLAILWNSAFRCLYLSFSPLLFHFSFSELFVRPPQTADLPFCISFSWG